MRIKEPVKISFWMDEFGVAVDEGTGARPQRWEGSRIIENIHVEAIFHVIVAHEAEDIIIYITEEVDLLRGVSTYIQGYEYGDSYIRLHTPVPVEVLEPRMLVKETAIPSTHMAVANHPSFAHTYGT